MDAWNDCMSDSNEVISIHIENAKKLKEKSPEIFNALVECTAFINYRLTEQGAQPLIALSYYV
ncbi:Barstar (barnase inhibitor) [Shewanella khirikhana]|uniref:Barstar (Barnase inhibitor) n=2 Tax=Shewanella khirikhana TaxID=1965282 RepID=A0ABN5TRD2_9GAMM|nr:Barstar (barnase inhibitor) [Shewanella khirikhana]